MDGFLMEFLVEFLPARDIVSLSLVCRHCHATISSIIHRVTVHPVMLVGDSFGVEVSRIVGGTEVRLIVQSPSLCKMASMLKMEGYELLQKVKNFKILGIDGTETLYRGSYIPPHPKMPGVSTLDVCSEWGGWRSATFLREEDDCLVVRYRTSLNREHKINRLSPRLSPPFYQICGGAAGGPVYRPPFHE